MITTNSTTDRASGLRVFVTPSRRRPRLGHRIGGLGGSLRCRVLRHLVRRYLFHGPVLLHGLLGRGARCVDRLVGPVQQVALDGDLRAGGAALADAGALADATTEVIQLRAANVAAGGHLDALDLWRVQREGPLHAHAERLLAHGEGLPGPVALALDDDALEQLGAPAGAFNHLEMDAQTIAGVKGRYAAELRTLQAVDHCAHRMNPAGARTRRGAGEAWVQAALKCCPPMRRPMVADRPARDVRGP
jgi:hypothetical protein